METVAKALAKINAKALCKTLAHMVAVVKFKKLANNVANVKPKELVNSNALALIQMQTLGFTLAEVQAEALINTQ